MKIVLTVTNRDKINCIKFVRSMTGLGLKEAKDVVEGAMPDHMWMAEIPRSADLTIHTKLAWDTVMAIARNDNVFSRVKRLFGDTKLTITESDQGTMLLDIESSAIRGRLYVDKKSEYYRNLLDIFTAAIRTN